MDALPVKQEEQLDKLIVGGQKEKAVEMMFGMAMESARGLDFERAEQLRDRIYELDSMALSEIVKLNEAIETEKGRALTPDRKRLWARFLEELSPQEANAFFFALKQADFQTDEVILRQGKHNARLYLVERGQLKVTHNNQDREQLIHKLSSGDVFGGETFFSINVCTVSVTALCQGTMSYLEREQLERLKGSFPFMEAVLKKVSQNGQGIVDCIRQKGIERRTQKRINLTMKIAFQVLTPDARKALQRPISVEMWDISQRGLSFYFNSKNQEAVRRLIGRTLGIQFNLPVNGQIKKVALTGVVHGVQNHPLDEYSVHLQLNRELSVQALQAIVRNATVGGPHERTGVIQK